MLGGAALALLFIAFGAGAQAQLADSKTTETKPALEVTQTFFLTNITQLSDLLDIQTDLRNMITREGVYSIASQNAISVRGTPEDIQLAQKIISELDRPKKTYRLTYTITETDSGKRTGTQSIVLIAALGQKTVFKQGSRVPIVTGSYDQGTARQSTQMQYQDVGLQIDATVDAYADGLRLHSKVEQSSLGDEKSGVGPQDPVIHQAVLEGTSTLALGKPLTLGSFDLPGSTRNQAIEVVAEVVR